MAGRGQVIRGAGSKRAYCTQRKEAGTRHGGGGGPEGKRRPQGIKRWRT